MPLPGRRGLLMVCLGMTALNSPFDANRAVPSRDAFPVAPRTINQTATTVDVGSFSLSLNGERIGREQFSIREVPGPDGSAMELRAESAIGSRRSAFRLELDSTGSPLRYAIEVRSGADITLRLGGQRVRGRFATLARGIRGEAAREYLLGDGVHVLDEDVVHQYAALVEDHRAMAVGDTATVPVVVPLLNQHGTMRLVIESKDDSVTIARARRTAWRWRVIAMDGDVRLLWTDAEGRLLRLVIPSRGFEAMRDDVPR